MLHDLLTWARANLGPEEGQGLAELALFAALFVLLLYAAIQLQNQGLTASLTRLALQVPISE